MWKIFLLFLLLAGVDTNKQYLENEMMEMIVQEINENKVILFSKTWCRYSKRIKGLLDHYPIEDMKTIELNLEPSGKEILRCLEQLSGIRTVPQLFVNGTFIGGYTDAAELEEKGKLRTIFESAGVLKK